MAIAAAAAKRKRRSKSVLKRIRQTVRRAAINRAGKSHLRTQVKRFRQALQAGNLAQARPSAPYPSPPAAAGRDGVNRTTRVSSTASASGGEDFSATSASSKAA